MPMNISEIFLIAILVIFAIPYQFWRLGSTDYYAFVFRAPMVQALGVPLLAGSLAAAGLSLYDGWVGPRALTWQFVFAVGSTMLTVPMVSPMLLRLRGVVGAAAEQRAATACMAGSWLISSALP
jgi:hypothetical protein